MIRYLALVRGLETVWRSGYMNALMQIFAATCVAHGEFEAAARRCVGAARGLQRPPPPGFAASESACPVTRPPVS